MTDERRGIPKPFDRHKYLAGQLLARLTDKN